jgi:hypothetical protein
MQKQLLTTAFLLTSALVYADYATESSPMDTMDSSYRCSDVYLSSPAYCFEVDFQALWMQPTASNLDYAAQANPFDFSVPVPPISPNWVIHEISPDYHFGFDVGVAGICHGTSSTLALNWERLHTSNDHNSTNPPSTSMVGPFFEIGPDSSFYKKAKGSVHFHFDEVSLDFGTFVKFGSRLRTNLFAGLGFTRIVQQKQALFSNIAGDIFRTIKIPSKFIGAGPQLGIDFTYRIAKGFQFVGDSRATLFVGRLKNSTTFSSTSPTLTTLGGPNPNIQTTRVDNRTGLVPGFEGRLGFAYDFEFNCRYMFKIEAGYQAQIYLNSIRSIDMGSEVTLSAVATGVAGDSGVYARTFERTISDFSLAGPYLSVSLGF